MAADTCVNVPPRTIQCNDDQYTQSIIYNVTSDLTLNVDSTATINSGSNTPGIAVYGQSVGNPASNIDINAKGITINTQGSPSDGILITQETSGNLSILADGVTINTTHPGNGANAVGTGITAALAGDHATGNISITAANGSITTNGKSSYGLYGLHSGVNGDVTVTTSSQIITHGLLSDGATAYLDNIASTGNVIVRQSGGEITTWNKAHGISAYTDGLGSSLAAAAGAITTHGDDSAAVRVLSQNTANTADVTAQLAGTARLQTSGQNSNGISLEHLGGGLITFEGAIGSTINTSGAQSHGILAQATTGNILINTQGTSISTKGEAAMGVAAVSANSTTVSADVDIAATGKFGVGMMATSTGGTTTVKVSQGATITGGWQALPGDTSALGFKTSSSGIVLGGTTAQLSNYGHINALSDRAITTAPDALTPILGDIIIDNHGTITGYLSLTGGGQNTFNNHSPNSLVIRNFADTDGDGIRDTKRVAINDFGGPNAVFNNKVTGAVRFAEVANATLTDPTGFYQPKTGVDDRVLNPGFYDLTREGIVQGQLVNLSIFNNAGVIDLRGPALGNTLVITDQAAANAAGGTGTFVSDGGSLRLNTALQAGLAAVGVMGSDSDMLIVDRTQLGSGATRINISNAPTSLGALTTGNGIELVEVRDAAHSADGAFALGQRVAAGAYEYTLHKGGTDLDAADGNWYLRSFAATKPTTPDYRQEVPLNMAMPALASRIGLSMLGTYHDRQGQDSLVSFDANNDSNKQNTFWSRMIAAQGSTSYGHTNTQHFESHNPSYDFTLGGFQVGLDTYRSRSANGEDFDQAGAYFGIAHIDSDVDDFAGVHAGNARLTGYSLGGYWTRTNDSGGYIDGVGQITYYGDATTRSRSGESSKTDGWGLTASIEGGYPFSLGKNWAIEPQAQLIAQHLKLNETTDSFGRIESDGATSVTGRLGVRLTKQWRTDSERPITAWARANIWHTFDSNVDTRFSNLNGEHPVVLQTALGSTVGQIGLGISGEVSKNTYVFATVNYNHALRKDSGESVSGQIGIKFQW